MINEEGKRLHMFIERVCKMSQSEFTEALNKAASDLYKDRKPPKVWTQSDISKLITGKMIIPTALLRIIHNKWQLNYEWFFEGTGTMRSGPKTDRKISNDITEILATVLSMEAALYQVRKTQGVQASEIAELKRINKELRDTTGTH